MSPVNWAAGMLMRASSQVQSFKSSQI
jgi:hypothetical protein